MKNIAVIGAGISGLAAAYLLSRRHRVQLFEKAERPVPSPSIPSDARG